jgi:hypothetical protein
LRLACAALLCLAACASPYQRPGTRELRLGETTPTDVVALLGAPSSSNSMVRNGSTLAVFTYVLQAEHEKPHGYDGIIPGRHLNIFFHGERLVAHEFSSTVATDHTDFDLRGMRAIVKGKTTREEVAKLLGPPGGYAIFPFVGVKTGEAMVYAYRESRRVPLGAPLVFSKTLLITFDKDGTVDEVAFRTSGSR